LEVSGPYIGGLRKMEDKAGKKARKKAQNTAKPASVLDEGFGSDVDVRLVTWCQVGASDLVALDGFWLGCWT
jgi:hypothetical protein